MKEGIKAKAGPKPTPVIDRLLAGIEYDTNGGCWLWGRAVNSKTGYGMIGVGGRGKHTTTHAAAYRALVGAVPPGLELDHLCRVRACCNPAHLEPGTHKVNMERGYSPSAISRRLGTCLRGHPRSPENTHVDSDGHSVCLACRRERYRKSVGDPKPLSIHCRRGHPRDEANLYVCDGQRFCRACNAINAAAKRARAKA